MNRYLLYLSYLGTRFKGSQKQFMKGVPLYPTETVESVLEEGLSHLKLVNRPVVYSASRTDQGVHALCTTAHVDLVFTSNEMSIYQIVKTLNRFFSKRDYDVRVLSVRAVPSTFSARYSVVRKKYLYRFAVLKSEQLLDVPEVRHIVPTPIIEKDRCYFVCRGHFDSERAQRAAGLFTGFKDFRAFMGRAKAKPDAITERSIESLVLQPGAPLMRTPETDSFSFWDVVCVGKSFLYKQVRRTVGVLLAVGQGKMTLDEVEALFDSPTNDTWNSKAFVVPGHGLYLANVEYREEDLLLEVNSESDKALCL